MSYYVYILLCSDESYYTGVTNNVEERFNQHQSGIDLACYTYSRRPLNLVFFEKFTGVLDAIAWEKQIKRWSRKKKEALIRGDWDDVHFNAMNGSNRDKLRKAKNDAQRMADSSVAGASTSHCAS